MRKDGNSYCKQLRHRAQALMLVTALTVTSFSSPFRASASTVTSYKDEISAALNAVQSGMASEDAYQNAVSNLTTSLDNLEIVGTVEGLNVKEVGADFITLEWNPISSNSLVGYNVYYADKDTSTQNFLKLTSEGKKTEEASAITVDKAATTFTVKKSTHKNYYFKVAPVLVNGEGTKSDIVESPTVNEFQSYLENLDRGLIKVATTEGVFLSWRLLGTEVTGYGTTGLIGSDFNVYQDVTKIATVTDSTNYVVSGGAIAANYYVVPVVDGKEIVDDKSAAATQMTTTQGAGYLDIPLQVPNATTIEEVYGISKSDVTLLDSSRTDTYTTTNITYVANDVSVGDVDGDGQYEFFVKWDPSLSKDVSQQGFTGKQYIDCYELDGTLLYRIDLGINIRAGAHYTQFTVFDFNEDGKAEISLKTAPGTKILKFNNNNQNDIASETYITTPDGTSNSADYVFTAAEYREYLITVFQDWGVWANDTEDMKTAKVKWDKNLINLFAPEDGMVTVVTESAGVYTSKKVTRAEAGFSDTDVLVNVPVRDSSNNVVYQGTGAVSPYMQTVKFDDPKTGLSASMYHDGGYTKEEATAIVDYFLNGYQYRMKKHNLNYFEGYIITGPEYLSVFNGETGAEMDTIMYEFEREDDGMLWGDYAMNYIEPGNRCDRFLSTVAYLDGENPYMVICRGYYTRATIATYSLTAEGKLQLHWTIDSGWTVMTNPFNDGPHGMNGNNTDVGTNGVSFAGFSGQGDHYVVAADVDDDGYQEIVYGGAIVDHNGDLYSSGGDLLPSGTWAKFGHGDSIHVTDIDPDRPGLEIFSCFEGGTGAPYGTAFRDAELNVALKGNYSVYTGKDTGRCMIGDLLPGTRGLETWGSKTTDAKGNIVSVNTIGTNQSIRWSADMTTQIYTNNIEKANGTTKTTVLTATDTTSNNGTKGNASLIADVFGDWREELIVRSTDNTKLRIYSNTEVTTHKMYTLMHDLQYRANVAGQNTAYNQPAYLSFYFASDTDWEYVPIPSAKDLIPLVTNVASGSAIVVSGSSVAASTASTTNSDDTLSTFSIQGAIDEVAKMLVASQVTTSEVKTYNEATWTDLDNKIATLNVKIGLMGDNLKPSTFDNSLVNKMIAVKAALTAVKGMPLVDTTAGDALIATAEDAIANAGLYTDSSLTSVKTSLEELKLVKDNISGMDTLVANAINVINYWLNGIKTTNIANAYSLYVDFDAASTTEYLSNGYKSVTVDSLYTKEAGYGLADTYSFINRQTGNSLFDDYVLDPVFYVDLPAGTYFVRAYCGDLDTNYDNTSLINISDADTGTKLVTDVNVTSDKGQVSYTDMTFSLTKATKVQVNATNRLNALLIDQKLPVVFVEDEDDDSNSSTPTPKVTAKPTATPTPAVTTTPAPTPVVSKDSSGNVTAKVVLKINSDNVVLIDIKALEKTLDVVSVDKVSVVIKSADGKTQAILSSEAIKELIKKGVNFTVELRNLKNANFAIWKYSSEELKQVKGDKALYLGVSTNVFNKENASKDMKKIKAEITDAVQVSLEADGVLPARGNLILYLNQYSKIFTKKDKVYIYGVDEKTGNLLEIPETNQTISNKSTVSVGLTEGGNYIITTKEVDPKYVKSLKEQVKVTVPSKEISTGKRQKMKVTLPSSLELATTTELKDANEVSIQYASSNKKVATVTKSGVVVAKKAGKVKITTTVVLENGSTMKYTTTITVK